MSAIQDLTRRRPQPVFVPEPLPRNVPAKAEEAAPKRLLRDESRFESRSPAKAPTPGKVDIEGIANMEDWPAGRQPEPG